MWLRASYTVENAVITPLFMLIIIVVMRASCDIHDNLIQRSVNSQFGDLMMKIRTCIE